MSWWHQYTYRELSEGSYKYTKLDLVLSSDSANGAISWTGNNHRLSTHWGSSRFHEVSSANWIYDFCIVKIISKSLIITETLKKKKNIQLHNQHCACWCFPAGVFAAQWCLDLFLYPLLNKVEGGYTGFTLSICGFVHTERRPSELGISMRAEGSKNIYLPMVFSVH